MVYAGMVKWCLSYFVRLKNPFSLVHLTNLTLKRWMASENKTKKLRKENKFRNLNFRKTEQKIKVKLVQIDFDLFLLIYFVYDHTL
jgi:hypothetical protein